MTTAPAATALGGIVSGAFGTAPVTVRLSPPRTGPADVAHARARLASIADADVAELDLMCPPPTAAFSSRDALLPGYARARADLEAHGFAPMVRPVGGHLAVYDQGALVVHLAAPHPVARDHIRERFEIFGAVLADTLRAFGVDARVGPVPGEYCDGAYSVNDAGRAKIVGTGQRITRAGYLLSAVVSVLKPSRVRAALEVGYADLGLDLRPETVGCVADSTPGVTVEEVRNELVATLARTLPIAAPQTPSLPAAV
ncbi:lipoate--protein ligase family protein [Streptomyces sp. SID8352]|uniref:lipoate--protein ligase family protein n=1 Tax=Streptomyces sp. SID8352 TaxID=2690338 RepID=UPI00136E0E54|nr:lipoate--protein ligase family protein [Streptomyces sp. SID8352]MYU21263.1 lipoate--protein ligase family protein [Streptomyces sp. SID8352]